MTDAGGVGASGCAAGDGRGRSGSPSDCCDWGCTGGSRLSSFSCSVRALPPAPLCPSSFSSSSSSSVVLEYSSDDDVVSASLSLSLSLSVVPSSALSSSSCAPSWLASPPPVQTTRHISGYRPLSNFTQLNTCCPSQSYDGSGASEQCRWELYLVPPWPPSAAGQAPRPPSSGRPPPPDSPWPGPPARRRPLVAQTHSSRPGRDG